MSQIQVDNIYNKEGTGSPNFPLGANVTGVVTATTFKGGAEITSGTISATSVTAASGTFTGPVTIGGTLTYEDVTNIDSVGVVTARNGLKVTAGGVNIAGGGINAVGVVTATNDIKANGNIIGDSSTNISGISSVTATNFYGNGASLSGIEAAPTIVATASGAIAANKPVVVNSDATVSEVAIASAVTGSDNNLNGGYAAVSPFGDWNSTGSYFVVGSADGSNSSKPTIKVGTLSGTTFTFGSNTDLDTGASSGTFLCKNVGGDRFVFIWSNASNQIKMRVGVYNSGSSSWTLGTTYSSNNVKELVTSVDYDPTNKRIAFTGKSSGNLYLCVSTVDTSNNTITNPDWGNVVTSSGAVYASSVSYMSAENRFCIVYQNSGLKARLTIDATTNGISFGAALGIAGSGSAGQGHIASCYDKDLDRVVFVNENDDAGGAGYFRIINITSTSNNTIAASQASNFGGTNVKWLDVAYNPLTKKSVVMYSDDAGTALKSRSMTLTASSITLDTAVTLKASISGQYPNITVNPASGAQVYLYDRSGAGNYIVLTPTLTNLRSMNFIGFSKAAYSNSATATINVVGNVSTQSGLTAGQKYYVQTNGTLSTVAGDPSIVGGISLSATSLLIQPS